ncbi:hypothetical protein M0R04_10145 [Candidatus Dojkabacteria bacterium]|jgi:hypothetical protein|nr:hypothetical protein [Candidatus Dojkabacteria bacterium]
MDSRDTLIYELCNSTGMTFDEALDIIQNDRERAQLILAEIRAQSLTVEA